MNYWLATSGGPFFVIILFFLITDTVVLSDSIFWLNKLGVIVSIILIKFLKSFWVIKKHL